LRSFRLEFKEVLEVLQLLKNHKNSLLTNRVFQRGETREYCRPRLWRGGGRYRAEWTERSYEHYSGL